MAQMTTEERTALVAELQRLFSQDWTEVPLTKAQLTTMVATFDVGMESAEASILAACTAAQRTWLQTHPVIARLVLAQVAEERQEVL